jgi:predicted phage tail protein
MEVLAKETKEWVLAEVRKTEQEVRGSGPLQRDLREQERSVQETKHELTALASLQEETKQEMQKQKPRHRISALGGADSSVRRDDRQFARVEQHCRVEGSGNGSGRIQTRRMAGAGVLLAQRA